MVVLLKKKLLKYLKILDLHKVTFTILYISLTFTHTHTHSLSLSTYTCIVILYFFYILFLLVKFWVPLHLKKQVPKETNNEINEIVNFPIFCITGVKT